MAQRDKMCDVKYDEVVRETEKAYLLRIGKREIWFAKSLLDLDDDKKIVSIPEWVAVDKELDNAVEEEEDQNAKDTPPWTD